MLTNLDAVEGVVVEAGEWELVPAGLEPPAFGPCVGVMAIVVLLAVKTHVESHSGAVMLPLVVEGLKVPVEEGRLDM